MKRLIVPMAIALAMLAPCLLQGQTLEVRCNPERPHVLFGEPVYATYTLTNSSQAPVYICASQDKSGGLTILRWHARAKGPSGVVPVHELWDEPQFKHKLAPGESATIHQPLPITDTTIDSLAPGNYDLAFEIQYSTSDQRGEWNKKAECHAAFAMDQPIGEDAGWIKALQDAARTADKADLRRPSPEAPLGWYEVLEGTVNGIVPSLLQRFPTSTYTGYILAQRGPREAIWAFTCLNDPDRELRKYSDFGAGEETTRQTIAKAQAEMTAYAKVARPFLQAHPDFIKAPLIRRMYAMCLGLTGCMPEALDQVRILAQGQGKEAEEAKAYLAAKGAK